MLANPGRLTLTGAVAGILMAGAAAAQQTGDVIFLHPDGTGVNHWGALRLVEPGPDGELNWDKLPALGVYTGHLKDALTATSHGGATVHAYGVKVPAASFGMAGERVLTAASGRRRSIAEEAMAAGKAVGLVQTGHIAEPGTAAFVASTASRDNRDDIARQVIEAGARVIMAGGERFLLPEGVPGRHGPGERGDALNLIERARELGYTVVYTWEELLGLDPASVDKLLGVFAHDHTFNDQTEEENRAEGKENYVATAPTLAEMTWVALQILARDPEGFLLVGEEEGTDNMGNENNAPGTLEALRRADEAVGVALEFIEENPETLLLMAADSDSGGMQVIGPEPNETELVAVGEPVAERDENGSPLDGRAGTASEPFMSAPDARGNSWPFAIAWASDDDVAGGILVRAAGLNSELVEPLMDNTDIYKLMYLTLFGRMID